METNKSVDTDSAFTVAIEEDISEPRSPGASWFNHQDIPILDEGAHALAPGREAHLVPAPEKLVTQICEFFA
jgi:hypothetical protein